MESHSFFVTILSTFLDTVMILNGGGLIKRLCFSFRNNMFIAKLAQLLDRDPLDRLYSALCTVT